MSILASCATRSIPPPLPVKPPAPAACDPRLQAEIPAIPDPPAGASIVAPATMDERVASSLFLTWVADLRDVAVQLAGRAGLAKTECEKR